MKVNVFATNSGKSVHLSVVAVVPVMDGLLDF